LSDDVVLSDYLAWNKTTSNLEEGAKFKCFQMSIGLTEFACETYIYYFYNENKVSSVRPHTTISVNLLLLLCRAIEKLVIIQQASISVCQQRIMHYCREMFFKALAF
jgi:hypothetical protein